MNWEGSRERSASKAGKYNQCHAQTSNKHKWSCFCSRNSASGAHSNRKGQKAVNCKDHTPLDLPQQITAKKINKRMTKGNYHDSLKKNLYKMCTQAFGY